MNEKWRLAPVPLDVDVVMMPAEVVYTDVRDVNAALLAAMASGTATVVADFTGTEFCDSAGIREMVIAQRLANAHGINLRLVVPPNSVSRVFALAGLDSVLPIYHTLIAALNPSPAT